MIQNDRLTSGDRLPSERELSERLGVGRSSVREAFRALELLGLIETRHGEGTFLRDFRDHHLVELLGMFILQHGQAENDVAEMKEWIEIAGIKRLLSGHEEMIKSLADSILLRFKQGELTSISQIKSFLLKSSGNQLAYKVWLVLHDFDKGKAKDGKSLEEENINKLKEALLSKNIDFIRSFCTMTR
ncbi:GntR family transcriptional regulator [Jeotgalibacillus proteolyticus]